ncbi:Acyl transferase/acyl hydrolase/lysophospholipase,Acyl transferase,Malonyl-CoA [Cinara cedri]|uniref:Acyl transferase/acyl hydrolase/lysophospholipase,Acyl transferase,Malonyl-CoA n=1 Tax=Cinara cedri TaxID=506608 RepID=A0A5E4NR30_9HEMI|nr:Acyl transferase/acyl hydrolase/lysophospholipase,Acyl transferase,Malonyl-CoA [Cinara cedri]
MELNVVDEVFCAGRRKTPLNIGSVKSNIGHCEASPFFASIVKVIIALETGHTPPTIHFGGPDVDNPALESGKIRVVTEKTPLVSDIIGVSGFGCTNAFCHIIINGNDREFITLTNNVFGKNINTHFYRSFTIFSEEGASQIEVQNLNTQKRPVWFMFSGMGSQWPEMGTDLMKIPVFANAINKCDLVLRPKGLRIKTILTSKDPKIFDNILYSFVGISAVQIGLIDLLRSLDITADGIIGHSLGESACAYADGCFTAEETILSAWARGRTSLDVKLISGMMAAVGLGHSEIKDQLPDDIDIACHNSSTNCTLSGPKDSINEFISTLKAKGVFAKAVNASGIAFHSRYIQSIGPILLGYLKEIIKTPKLRSSKWISTSLPETEWNSEISKYSSAEYHTNTLLNSVLFEESLKHIPSDAILIEIAPHGLLQAIVKRALPNTIVYVWFESKCTDLIPNSNISRESSLPLWDHDNRWTMLSTKRLQYQIRDCTDRICINSCLAFVYANECQNIFGKPCSFPKNLIECYLLIQRGSGLFEFNLNNKTICSGQIHLLQDDLNVMPEHLINLHTTAKQFQEFGLKEKIYSIFEDNGCNLGDNYKNITEFNVHKNNIEGCIKWKNDWIYFLDSLLKFPLLEDLTKNCTKAPVSIRGIIIRPDMFENSTEQDVFDNYDTRTNEITRNGVKISGVRNEPIVLSNSKVTVGTLEEQIFIQYNHSICKNIDDFINDTLNIIMELDKFDFFENTGKLFICTQNTFNDPTCNVCAKAMKQIIENQPSSNSITINLDNVSNVSEDDESGQFILVTSWNYLKYTTEYLADKKCCYIIVCSKQKCQNFNDWKIIIQQQFNGDIYLTLMKKKITIDKNYKFIKSTNEDYDLNIWNALEKHKSTNELICIVSKSEPLDDIVTHVKNILVKYKSPKLRFVFIFDSNAPEIESNKLFYTNELRKDLIVNIYKNGGWGCYKNIFFQDLKTNTMATKVPVIENILNNSTNELTIKYLGLNFKDLLIEAHTEDELELFKYSGIAEGNERVMGIFFFNQSSYQINYDEAFAWPVPTTWQLDDAVTVPLAYAMTILVTSGLHPVGRAAISIGLAEKCDVYVIFKSSQQSKQLSNIFPQLITKAKGIDIILNFLSGEAYQCALRTLAKHGKFFHFSKSDIKNQENLETRIFLQNTAFYFVSSNLLINESDENKEIVKQAFSDGLKKGITKPFEKNVLETPISNSKIFEAMSIFTILFITTYSSNIIEKVIVSLNNDCGIKVSQKKIQCDTYQCHPDHVYVIFDNISDSLILVKWLAERGAKKIVIVLKRLLISSIDCKILNAIISLKVSIQIESDIQLNSRDESLKWLSRLTSSRALGSIFIINQCDDSKINNLQYAVNKLSNKSTTTSFVCISSKGEHACASLKSIGLNALNMRWDKISKSNKNVSNILLPALDKLLQYPNADETFSFVLSEKIINKFEEYQQTNYVIENFLPESLEELLHLNDEITKEAKFVEIPSKSPSFCTPNLVKTLCSKLLFPVFEAQYPENIGSVDELSNSLVYGGIVALKMAQILENQGTLVTVTLLEGNPEELIDWAKTFLSNDNYLNKSYTKYSSSFSKVLKCTDEKYDSRKLQLLKENTRDTLNWIHSYLQVLLESKPLSSKLLTKVLILRYERKSKYKMIRLTDYCNSLPSVKIIPKKDYKQILTDVETVDILHKNMAYLFTKGIELLC